jgi:putative nucleotidyltransferase with HDIG domain
MPLRYHGTLLGALGLGVKFTGDPYSREDHELLRAVSNHLATALHNRGLFLDLAQKLEENEQLYQDMRRIYHDTIQAFAAAIDAKDAYTKNHSYRVARYAVAIGRQLGWDEHRVEGLYVAGLLHDVGKIVLNIDLLNKEHPLTESDIEEIKKHPNLSYEIISKINFPWQDVIEIVRHHHERLDGNGYPDHLDDHSLSDGARILTLADSFDAMTTDRPYREKLSLAEALRELRDCCNTQFDGHIIEAFCAVLEKEIRGDLAEPEILPHLDSEFDPQVIINMLRAIREELIH